MLFPSAKALNIMINSTINDDTIKIIIIVFSLLLDKYEIIAKDGAVK